MSYASPSNCLRTVFKLQQSINSAISASPSRRTFRTHSNLQDLGAMSGKEILDIETPIIPLSESKRFIFECMEAAGCSKENAQTIAENLITADYRGHYSHGMNRLEMYVNDVISEFCDGKATPEILKETPATAWVDGKNGLGAVVGKFCMELAIRKAKDVGVGWVSCKGSNHYGINFVYSNQAVQEGLLGMAFTNTSPIVVPTRSKDAAIGTNPLSLSAPALNGDHFNLDMATSVVAVGKIEIQNRKNLPIPEGWAMNENGEVETNAERAFEANRVFPLGGAEIHSGFKGYGLGMLVEIFSGILGGANYGPFIRKWGDFDKPANLGHCFIAVDPKCFAPGFEERLSDLMDYLRKMEPVDQEKPVLVAGDPERMHMASVDKHGGVRYVPNQLESCSNLSKKFNIKPLRPKE